MRVVSFQRDPRDRRYPERLAGSTLASLLLHVLLALLFFVSIVSSSQQGATENVSGGEVVTVERRSPVAVTQPAVSARTSAPVPNAPRVAPVAHPPVALPQRQPLPQNRHELSRVSPTAPPNPKPIPQQSLQPNPQPTLAPFSTVPQNQVAAAPVAIPTVAPVNASIKVPQTPQPSPQPTAVASAVATARPQPTAAPTRRPATPAPPAPTAAPTSAPTAAAVAVKASAAPSASPAPAARASAPPAPRPGVPSPSPTQAAAIAKTAGAAPSPGPKGTGSPGPRAGNATASKPAPERPIAVAPTASPAPNPRPASSAAAGLNARLRSLLPNNAVNPTFKQYTPNLSIRGKLEPTPPPDVLAKTKYIYDMKGSGNEAQVKMWVTDAHKSGPTTMCTGWLVRYPEPEHGGYDVMQNNVHIGPANGTQLGGSSQALGPSEAGLAPIVEGIVTIPCEGRRLTPYDGSAPAPSP